jgi:hypothetical protein
MPGIVGSLVAQGSVVVGAVVVDVVVVVVGSGSPVTVPITQYNWLVSRLGQIIPGLSCCKSLTESPQLLAKLEHVAPESAVVEKSHETARRFRATAMAGIAPIVRRAVKYIILHNYLVLIKNESVSERFLLKI